MVGIANYDWDCSWYQIILIMIVGDRRIREKFTIMGRPIIIIMCQTEFGGWGWHYHFLWRNMEHGFGDWQELSHILIWLVISTPLKNISSSVGMILPNIWKNKTCSKPPTSDDHHHTIRSLSPYYHHPIGRI